MERRTNAKKYEISQKADDSNEFIQLPNNSPHRIPQQKDFHIITVFIIVKAAKNKHASFNSDARMTI